jgi:hypothetical protein
MEGTVALADDLRAELVKNLAAIAVGQGGSPDVFTPALDKLEAQAAEATGGQA